MYSARIIYLRGCAQASQNVMEDSLFNQEQSRNVTTLTKWVSSSRIMERSRDGAHLSTHFAANFTAFKIGSSNCTFLVHLY